MLYWFRKQARSRWVKILFYFLALTFFGGFGILSSGRIQSCVGGGVNPEEAVAIVDGVEISAIEFARAVDNSRQYWLRMMRDQYDGDVPLDVLEGIDFKSQVMDQMIEGIILKNKAREWGVAVSDAEVRQLVAMNPYFADQSGRFNRDMYLSILARQGLSEAAFEDRLREDRLIDKLMSIVGGSARLLEGEARERYIFEQEKINLEYLSFDIDERFDDAKPTEDEVKEYYEDNKDRFDLPETRMIRFFKLHVPDYEDSVRLTRDEVEEYYEDAKDRYMIEPEKAELRHIFIQVGADDPADKVETAKAMAEDLVARARDGADFAELARNFSQDASTRDAGGYVGELSRGNLVPDIERMVFSLEPGEISEPLRRTTGFVIFKMEGRTDAEYQPLAEVEDEVKDTLKRTKAFALARLDGDTVITELNAGKTLEQIGEERGINIYKSEFFHRDEREVPDITDMYQVASEAYFLEKGQASDVIGGLDDLYVIELVDIAEPHQASIDEARDKIVRIIDSDIRKKRALEQARGYLDELKAGSGIREVARKAGLDWQETGLFPRSAPDIPGIGYSEELKVAAFSLGGDKPWPEDVYELNRRMLLLHFKEKQDADLEEFDNNPDEFEQKMLFEKQEEIFERFKEDIKRDAVQYTELYDKI